MCNSKYYDAISVGVSILVGIVLSVLGLLNLLTAGALAPILGMAFGGLCLLLLTIGASSLLKQGGQFAACLCQKGVRLLVSALLLMIVCAFTLVFLLTNLVISLILGFLIFTLFSYTIFSLYCLISCLVRAGCAEAPTACVVRM